MIGYRLLATMTLTWILAIPVVAEEPKASPPKALGSPTREAGVKFFETRIRPILADHCYRCHGPESGEGKAKLRVDAIESLLRGGVSGPALIRGEPDRSLLILAIRHDSEVSMPPKQKLPQADIDALTAWVEMGAPGMPTSRGFRRSSPPTNVPAGPTRRDSSGHSRFLGNRSRLRSTIPDGLEPPSTVLSWRGSKPKV